jgi:hypothetical protein
VRLPLDLHRNLQYDAHGPRDAATVRRLEAPQEVDVATWEPGGLLDAWVFNRRDGEWIGRVRRPDGMLRAACSVDLSAMKDEKTSILYPLTVLPRSGRVGRKHQERSVAVLFDLDDDFCHRSSSANAVSEGPEPVGRVE